MIHNLCISRFEINHASNKGGEKRVPSWEYTRLPSLLPLPRILPAAHWHRNARETATNHQVQNEHTRCSCRNLTRHLPTTKQHLEARQVGEFVPWGLLVSLGAAGLPGYRYWPLSSLSYNKITVYLNRSGRTNVWESEVMGMSFVPSSQAMLRAI